MTDTNGRFDDKIVEGVSPRLTEKEREQQQTCQFSVVTEIEIKPGPKSIIDTLIQIKAGKRTNHPDFPKTKI